jgi:hypothetical protein
MRIETHIKTVRGKTVLVPSLALLQKYLPKHARMIDAQALRQAMTADHNTALVCPVTLRRHFRALGLSVKPKPAR